MVDRNEEFDVIILGAGVTGLSCAYFLKKLGLATCVLDSYPTVGGNHISKDFNGFTFDVGSIFFWNDNPNFKIFPGTIEKFSVVDLAFQRLTPRRIVAPYPLSVSVELLRHPSKLLRAVISLFYSKICLNTGYNAESYAIYHLGKFIYNWSGLSNYLRRFYGIEPSKVSLAFVERRMVFSGLTSPKNILKKFVSRINLPSAGAHNQSLALARPKEGFHEYYNDVAAILQREGVEIRCATRMHSINKKEEKFEICVDGSPIRSSRVINTLPLKNIFQVLDPDEYISLASTALCTLCCSFKGERGFSAVVLYNFDTSGSWKRLTMHSDYYGRRSGREYFGVEVIYRRTAIMPDPQALFDDFRNHTSKNDLFVGDLRLEGHIDLDFAYPLCDLSSELERNRLIAKLEDFGIETVGRQGRFDYIPHSSIATEEVRERYGKGFDWIPFKGPPPT